MHGGLGRARSAGGGTAIKSVVAGAVAGEEEVASSVSGPRR
jgi:hypothetical protein